MCIEEGIFMDRESFLREYNIDEATFESARTCLGGVQRKSPATTRPSSRSSGPPERSLWTGISTTWRRPDPVSYRYRAKDHGASVAKIIRKRNENFEKYENINSQRKFL